MTYPQPREGVEGTDRSDLGALLSLSEEHIPVRTMLAGLAKHLQTATTVGHPAPVVSRMSQRMRTPQVGDYVIETSVGLYTQDIDRLVHSSGILLARRAEWWHTDEEWAQRLADGDWSQEDGRPVDPDVFYVQYGPAAEDIGRWVNCSFMTLPWREEKFDVDAFTRDGTAAVFTRDSLLGGLADSGFDLRLPGT